PRRARPRPGESYEERSERRQEARERLRGRNNVTCCRAPGRPAPQAATSPRQAEFLRRRNLAAEAGETLPGHEPEAATPPDPSPRVEPRPSIPLQVTAPRLEPIPLQVTAARAHPAPGQLPAASPSAGLSSPRPNSQQAVPHSATKLWGRCSQSRSLWNCQSSSASPCCPSASSGPTEGVPVPQEALHRELLLKQKMVILQELLSTLLQASEKSWQGQLNEDKLRCKLRVLENQLQACSQNYSKECVKKILIEMEDHKQTYEQKAKEALQKMLEEKLQAEQQLQNSRRSLAEMRENLSLWKEHNATLKAELSKEVTAHTELRNSFQALQSELQVPKNHIPSEKKVQGSQQHLLHSAHVENGKYHPCIKIHRDLHKPWSSVLISDKLQKEQEHKVTLEATISHLQNLIHNQNNQQKSQEVTVQRTDQVFTTQTPPLTPAKEKQNALSEHPEEEEEEEEGAESLKDEMQKRTSQLTAKENECSELRSELEALSQEYQSCLTRLRQCRDELNRSHGCQAQRQRGPWIPLLVAVAAVAIAAFLATYR
ncbi:T3JAM protein, partial [Motacilla alba]|nr:T3JAM protein [Motacilla alba]